MPEDSITYMSGNDIIIRAKKTRDEFAGLWSGLTEEQMIHRPGPQDDWSVKDLIAHIVWWEQHMVEWVEMAVRGETITRNETIEEVNERVFKERNDWSLKQVLDEFETSFPKIETLVASLSDEQINNETVANIMGRKCLDYIKGDTFEHYQAHWDDLEQYVQSINDK